MAVAVLDVPRSARSRLWLPLVTATLAIAFIADPALSLAREWWTETDAQHGLLLAPLAGWLAWRRRLVGERRAAPWIGLSLLFVAIVSRYAAELAAEVYTARLSIVLLLAGMTVFHAGLSQLKAWWLPFVLLTLAIPAPSVVIATIALPLQLEASRLGAALLEMRNVPVHLAGNVIRLPNHDLFVAEACSGLRSLTALLSIGVLAAGMWLNGPLSRCIIIAATIPIAVLVNAFRVFLTGYMIYFIGPEAGQGVLHLTEGWLLFVVSLGAVLSIAAAGRLVENVISNRAGRDSND